jgi:hypothetical protein
VQQCPACSQAKQIVLKKFLCLHILNYLDRQKESKINCGFLNFVISVTVVRCDCLPQENKK